MSTPTRSENRYQLKKDKTWLETHSGRLSRTINPVFDDEWRLNSPGGTMVSALFLTSMFCGVCNGLPTKGAKSSSSAGRKTNPSSSANNSHALRPANLTQLVNSTQLATDTIVSAANSSELITRAYAVSGVMVKAKGKAKAGVDKTRGQICYSRSLLSLPDIIDENGKKTQLKTNIDRVLDNYSTNDEVKFGIVYDGSNNLTCTITGLDAQQLEQAPKTVVHNKYLALLKMVANALDYAPQVMDLINQEAIKTAFECGESLDCAGLLKANLLTDPRLMVPPLEWVLFRIASAGGPESRKLPRYQVRYQELAEIFQRLDLKENADLGVLAKYLTTTGAGYTLDFFREDLGIDLGSLTATAGPVSSFPPPKKKTPLANSYEVMGVGITETSKSVERACFDRRKVVDPAWRIYLPDTPRSVAEDEKINEEINHRNEFCYPSVNSKNNLSASEFYGWVAEYNAVTMLSDYYWTNNMTDMEYDRSLRRHSAQHKPLHRVNMALEMFLSDVQFSELPLSVQNQIVTTLRHSFYMSSNTWDDFIEFARQNRLVLSARVLLQIKELEQADERLYHQIIVAGIVGGFSLVSVLLAIYIKRRIAKNAKIATVRKDFFDGLESLFHDYPELQLQAAMNNGQIVITGSTLIDNRLANRCLLAIHNTLGRDFSNICTVSLDQSTAGISIIISNLPDEVKTISLQNTSRELSRIQTAKSNEEEAKQLREQNDKQIAEEREERKKLEEAERAKKDKESREKKYEPDGKELKHQAQDKKPAKKGEKYFKSSQKKKDKNEEKELREAEQRAAKAAEEKRKHAQQWQEHLAQLQIKKEKKQAPAVTPREASSDASKAESNKILEIVSNKKNSTTPAVVTSTVLSQSSSSTSALTTHSTQQPPVVVILPTAHSVDSGTKQIFFHLWQMHQILKYHDYPNQNLALCWHIMQIAVVWHEQEINHEIRHQLTHRSCIVTNDADFAALAHEMLDQEFVKSVLKQYESKLTTSGQSAGYIGTTADKNNFEQSITQCLSDRAKVESSNAILLKLIRESVVWPRMDKSSSSELKLELTEYKAKWFPIMMKLADTALTPKALGLLINGGKVTPKNVANMIKSPPDLDCLMMLLTNCGELYDDAMTHKRELIGTDKKDDKETKTTENHFELFWRACSAFRNEVAHKAQYPDQVVRLQNLIAAVQYLQLVVPDEPSMMKSSSSSSCDDAKHTTTNSSHGFFAANQRQLSQPHQSQVSQMSSASSVSVGTATDRDSNSTTTSTTIITTTPLAATASTSSATSALNSSSSITFFDSCSHSCSVSSSTSTTTVLGNT